MRINTINIRNFKLFHQCDFDLSPKNVTVLIGRNNTGKSTVLDALSIVLGGFLSLFDEVKRPRPMDPEDATIVKYATGSFERKFPIDISCSVTMDNKNFRWNRSLSGIKGRSNRLPENLLKYTTEVEKRVRNGQEVLLPVLAYYGTSRLWAQKRDRKQVDLSETGSRFLGYTNCLDPDSDEKMIQKWFKRMALIRFQEASEPGVMSAVREAVAACLERVESVGGERRSVQVDFSARADEVLVTFSDSSTKPVRLLSDGYRSMIGLVADIAYRMAVLNPHLEHEATRKTPGVVLIDEIDLHLHPVWQRHILTDLQRIFPEVQFIVTTHSPFIIQSLSEDQLIVLENPGSVKYEQMNGHLPGDEPVTPQQSVSDSIQVEVVNGSFYNMSIEDISEYLMGVTMPQWSDRRNQMHQAAIDYYQALDQLENEDEDRIKELRDRLDELSKPFAGDIAFTAFLEHKRLVAEKKRKRQED